MHVSSKTLNSDITPLCDSKTFPSLLLGAATLNKPYHRIAITVSSILPSASTGVTRVTLAVAQISLAVPEARGSQLKDPHHSTLSPLSAWPCTHSTARYSRNTMPQAPTPPAPMANASILLPFCYHPLRSHPWSLSKPHRSFPRP